MPAHRTSAPARPLGPQTLAALPPGPPPATSVVTAAASGLWILTGTRDQRLTGGSGVRLTGRVLVAARSGAGGTLLQTRGDGGDQVLLVDDGGHARLLDAGSVQGLAVSADGRRGVWARSSGGRGPSTLVLAQLPSGRVLWRVALPVASLFVAGVTRESALVSTGDGGRTGALLWNLGTTKMERLYVPGPGQADVPVDGFVAGYPAGDTAVVRQGDGICWGTAAVSRLPLRVHHVRCDVRGGALSPGGSRLLGFDGSDRPVVAPLDGGRTARVPLPVGTVLLADGWETDRAVLVALRPASAAAPHSSPVVLARCLPGSGGCVRVGTLRTAATSVAAVSGTPTG